MPILHVDSGLTQDFLEKMYTDIGAMWIGKTRFEFVFYHEGVFGAADWSRESKSAEAIEHLPPGDRFKHARVS